LLKIFFPLPPLEIQEKIVKHIWEVKEEIKSLKKLSEELKESAKVEFEKEIFS
jgi:restriction endonuclease S subunit